MDLFEDAAGATIDMLIELAASAFLACGILFLARDSVAAGSSWFFLLVGIALVALEVSRILRGEYVFGAGPYAWRVRVDTTSVPYFVADALLVTLGAAGLIHTFVTAPGVDPQTDLDLGYAVPVAFLAVALGVLGTRTWACRRQPKADAGFPADLAGAVLDFFVQAFGLFCVTLGGAAAYQGILGGGRRAGLLVLAAGAALLVLVARRIVHGGYVLNKDALPITVSTVSAPYFGSDALFLGYGAAWLCQGLGPISRPWFEGGGVGTGPATAFVALAAALLLVRVWSRLRVRQ